MDVGLIAGTVPRESKFTLFREYPAVKRHTRLAFSGDLNVVAINRPVGQFWLAKWLPS
jgi:hypothetical protein